MLLNISTMWPKLHPSYVVTKGIIKRNTEEVKAQVMENFESLSKYNNTATKMDMA